MNQPTAPTHPHPADLIESLNTMANRLRRHSIATTSEAGSGHPSTCLSCAELVSALFFHSLRFDVPNPDNPLNDRFVLSKGHGVPIVWAAWAEAGAFPVDHLMTLRQIDSDLEGHPTPRCPWSDVATGSLGQGLSIGVGMAISARLDGLDNRIYVLTGDGELAEGSIWEAAMLASHLGLDNLIAVLDINGLGQSQRTMYGHDVELYRDRFESFGWNARAIDGHDMGEVLSALDEARQSDGKPFAVVARTLKGKGVSFMEDKDGWHGKPIPKGEQLDRALEEVGGLDEPTRPLQVAPPEGIRPDTSLVRPMSPPSYELGESVATRQAYGPALAKLGEFNPRVVALDGDTKNSTYSIKFMQEFEKRFVECYIAESNMVGVGVGLSVLGKVPFASTFACFFTRAYDQIRMGAISRANLKLCGSHCGVSIGEDGPSQMGLEDLAMMRAVAGSTVLYPSDAVSTERLVEIASKTPGIVYIRTTRPKTPVLYSADDEFRLGGSRTHRSEGAEDRAAVVSAGVTLNEALKAREMLAAEGIPIRVIDVYSIKPIDADAMLRAVRETRVLITVEDHYPEGGLGDAVLGAVAGESFRYRKMAVEGLPRSGSPEALMKAFKLTASDIAEAVRKLVA